MEYCWVQRLQEYHFTSDHCQGRKHTNADALSRRPCQEEFPHCREVAQRADLLKIKVVTAATAEVRDRIALRREQLADDDVGQLLQEVEAGQRTEWRDNSDRNPVY
jgi:hypothetical protein